MKVSLNLVKKFINLDGLTPQEIADRLTFAGVEVESINNLATGSNLVVGEVLTCENMPNSDHLHLTTVNAGSKYGVLNIVCGAPNVRKGLKVIVATDGAKLIGGTIKKGKIRGYDSEGMLCSLLELGVEAKYLSEYQMNGIEELTVGEVGDENVLALLGLDDVILDLKLLANRSDLYSVLNVAKELETLFDNRKAILPTYEVVNGEESGIYIASLTEKCPQFSMMEVHDITVKESPTWLKNALRSSGIRSINNIVDIGNYVMLLTGQPLHMYDLDKLPKNELVVRDDLDEEFIALDEKTYKIKPGDIVVTSNEKTMCLGGVMGSLRCAVDENTKNILVEAANFDFAMIRRTSTRLNLVSDSSQRFVKGINPNQYDFVMALTLSLLKDLCDAKKNYKVKTYLKEEYKKKILNSSISYINNRLGTSFSCDIILETLNKAFIKVEKINENDFVAYIPDSRIDIKDEADLSEEVIRILGFDNIVSTLPDIKLSLGGLDENILKKRQVRSYLRGVGLDEQLTYSLVSLKESVELNLLREELPYKIMNALTDERMFYRTNLLPSLLNALKFNLNRGNNDLAFFEVSDIYTLDNKKHIELSVVLYGNNLRQGRLDSKKYSYYDLKGLAEGIIKLFDIDLKRINLMRAEKKELHPGKSAIMKLDGKILACFGELHPNYSKNYELKESPLVLTMDLDVLFMTKTNTKKMVEVSKYPPIVHDLSLVVKDNISSQQIIQEIYKINREIIKNVEVFDVYKGEHLDEQYVSIALSITYSSNEKTLQTGEVSEIEQKIIKMLENKFAIKLRE